MPQQYHPICGEQSRRKELCQCRLLMWPVCECSASAHPVITSRHVKTSQRARTLSLNIWYICIIKIFRPRKNTKSAIFLQGKDCEYQCLSTIAVVVPPFVWSQLIFKAAPPKWIFFNFHISYSVGRNRMFSEQVDYTVLAQVLHGCVYIVSTYLHLHLHDSLLTLCMWILCINFTLFCVSVWMAIYCRNL